MPPSPFDPLIYGPAFAALVAGDRCRPLDDKSAMPTAVRRSGHAAQNERQALHAMSLEAAFAHAHIVDQDMARCCLAAVWLLHDNLDESHQLSQAIDTPTGNFWHGVMHRREGDFSNSKYWFARIGRHEALPLIGARIQDWNLAGVSDPVEAPPTLLHRIAPGGMFDPRAMTDACQMALRTGANEAHRNFCRRAQQAEWEALFDYCYRQALGA